MLYTRKVAYTHIYGERERERDNCGPARIRVALLAFKIIERI